MAREPATVTATDFLAVVGMADLETNTASLENVYLISQDNTLPLPDPGDWTIALVGAANNDLATYPFAPDELTDAEEEPGTAGCDRRGRPLDTWNGQSGDPLRGAGDGFTQRQRQRADCQT